VDVAADSFIWCSRSVAVAVAVACARAAGTRVLHFVKQSSRAWCCCCATRDYEVLWSPMESFHEILVSGLMVKVCLRLATPSLSA
jgi:hypothetical protein